MALGDYYGSDGSLGFLLNPTAYGAGTYSTTWSLEFQMNAGFDGLGSFATIDNVSLTAVTQDVPAPTALWMIGLGVLGLVKVQRKNKVALTNI